MEFKIGQVVISQAGRDEGCLLAVAGFKEGKVLVCDGKERPLERAKAKNPRHLKATSTFIDESSMATNPKLRKTLRALREQRR
ncbi:MAG: KOW domain-containing RNA-binding protein [Ruminococcus sp.]|nr:KOW domain-containing RNA-binding protein [Bacteroidales bacterium]MCM1544013.1 KOW domain-containing RNA-binding protein [Ruminococcus sp.]